MNPILKKIKHEWEKSLLTVILLAVLLCLAAFAYVTMNTEDHSGNDRSRFRTPHAYFDVKSRVYMEGPALDKKARSPMSYRLKIKIPPVEKVKDTPRKDTKGDKKTANPKKGNEKKNVAEKPKKVPEKPKETAVKPKPKEPPVKVTVKYRGCMQLLEDQPVAFCTSVSSKDNKSLAVSLHRGDKVHGMMLIDAFDENALTLSYKGEKVKVPRGKVHVFTVEQ